MSEKRYATLDYSKIIFFFFFFFNKNMLEWDPSLEMTQRGDICFHI